MFCGWLLVVLLCRLKITQPGDPNRNPLGVPGEWDIERLSTDYFECPLDDGAEPLRTGRGFLNVMLGPQTEASTWLNRGIATVEGLLETFSAFRCPVLAPTLGTIGILRERPVEKADVEVDHLLLAPNSEFPPSLVHRVVG